VKLGEILWRFEGMISELLTGMGHSSTAGFVGVSLIGIYFVWMICMALYRIQQGKNEGHH
jgi:hypothetical protein